MSRLRENVLTISKTVLSLVLILVPPLYFGCKGSEAEMGVALAAGALAAAFLNIDKLQRFKGAGIEFELRKAVEEAQATLENLKEFTDPLYISSIKIMSEGHSYGGVPQDIQHDIVLKIKRIADNNGISEDVAKAINDFYHYYLNKLYGSLINEVEGYFKPDVLKKLPLLRDEDKGIFPSEKQVRQVLSELPHISAKLEEKIKDYGYYKENLYPRGHS